MSKTSREPVCSGAPERDQAGSPPQTVSVRSGLLRPGSIDDSVRVRDVDVKPIRDRRELAVGPAGAAAHALAEGDAVQPEHLDQVRLRANIGKTGASLDLSAQALREHGCINGIRREKSRPPAARRRGSARPALHILIDVGEPVLRGGTVEAGGFRERGIRGLELVDGADLDLEAVSDLRTVQERIIGIVGGGHDSPLGGLFTNITALGDQGAECGAPQDEHGSRTQFRNLVRMGTSISNREAIRQDLRDVAEELSAREEILERRGELIDAARSAQPPLTFREIADLVGMTERGAQKALDAYRRKHHVQALAS
ncbi:hypothetical protein [Microbacterium panaciterrae]